MYDGFDYVSKNGITLKENYRQYNARLGKCEYKPESSHFKNLGFVETDGLSNAKLM